MELLVRDDIERARTVLRLNDFAGCETLLRSAERRLSGETDPALGILTAVIQSLRAQALRAQTGLTGGSTELVKIAFGTAISAFEAFGRSKLGPRDRGDLGIAFAAVGRLSEARTELEAAVADDKAPPEASRELGRVLLTLGKPGKAKPLIEKAISALPGDPQLYLLQAEASEGQHAAAAADSFVQAGILFLASGRPLEALDAADRALAANGEVAGVIGVRAEALRQLDRAEEALPLFDRALREGQSPQLYVRRAAARVATGDMSGAEADVRQALDSDPDDVDVLVLASQVRHDRGDLASAQALAGRAYANDPSNWRAMLRMAETWRDGGEPLRALDSLRTAGALARIQPQVLRLHLELALAYADPEEALDLFDRLGNRRELTAEETYAHAQLLADSGRLNEAMAVTGRGTGRWPENLDLRTLDVELKLESNDVSAALTSAEDGVREHPDNAAIYLLKAAALVADPSDDPGNERARAATLHAAQLAPDWAEPWWLQAQISWQALDFTGTRAALTEILRREPDHSHARRLEVELYLEEGNFAEAERLARDLATTPGLDQPVGQLVLAKVLDAQHRSGEASAEVRDLDEVDFADVNDAAEMLILRVRLALEILDFDRAERDLAQAAELTPNWSEIWYRRSQLARSLKDGQRAAEYAQRALDLSPDSVDVQIEAVAAYELAGEMVTTERIRTELDERWPDEPSVRLWKAQQLFLTDAVQAREEVARLVEEGPTNLDARAELARINLDLGNYQEALEALRGIDDDNLDANLLALRAEIQRMLDQPEKAIIDATRALGLVPMHPDSLTSLGWALLDSRNDERAVEVFQQAFEAAPYDPTIRRWLGIALSRSQRFDEALDLLDGLALEQPGDEPSMVSLADLLSDAGVFGQAAVLYRKVCAVNPENKEAWSGLGWCLQHDSPPDLEAADTAYRTAAKIRDDPWIRKDLANIHHLCGRHDEAAALYRQVHDVVAHSSERTDLMGLNGWCLFRLGELGAAARALYEASKAMQRIGSEHFDLALVNLCAGQPLGRLMYENLYAVPDIHPQFKRGLLSVARRDLDQAMSDFPETAGGSVGAEIRQMLTNALQSLAPLSETKTVNRLVATEQAGA